MNRTFILDTSVILFDPQAIFKFAENDVFIPLTVVEEVDVFKRDQTENGRNARHFSRLVDSMRTKGQLSEGVKMDSGGRLIFSINYPATASSEFLDLGKNDNLILASALYLKEQKRSVTLVSKDINLRLKADALGIKAEDYGLRGVSVDELYSGQVNIKSDKGLIDKYRDEKALPASSLSDHKFVPNQYVLLSDGEDEEYQQVGRYDANADAIVPLVMGNGVWGITPRNIEQQFALDALLNPDIALVTLVGKAGTGKTLMAIAAGLEMAISREVYNRLLVSRPVHPMGKDLGFLPGDINEKLAPWMQPIFDNMDFLFGQTRSEGSASYEDLINHGLLHIEPLTYIRGRSISGQFLIVDEAQNLPPHEVKTIITRAGEGTKVVLTGDCNQIDNPYLDEINNGLVYCLERLKEEKLVAHTLLKTGERSKLSEVASKHL